MQYPVLPPELNSLRLLSGAGSGPMHAAAQAWDGLASSLRQASSSFGNVTSNLSNGAWQGAASQAMAQAAAPYAAWLAAAAAHSETAAGQSRLVASAFEAARSAIVPLQSISSNRNTFVSAIRANIFGQLTPMIMALEGMYEEMWAQDVSAISGYHAGASSSAASLAPLGQLMQSLPGMLGGMGGMGGGAPMAGGAGPTCCRPRWHIRLAGWNNPPSCSRFDAMIAATKGRHACRCQQPRNAASSNRLRVASSL